MLTIIVFPWLWKKLISQKRHCYRLQTNLNSDSCNPHFHAIDKIYFCNHQGNKHSIYLQKKPSPPPAGISIFNQYTRVPKCHINIKNSFIVIQSEDTVTKTLNIWSLLSVNQNVMILYIDFWQMLTVWRESEIHRCDDESKIVNKRFLQVK